MITLCKKTLHSFLGLSSSQDHRHSTTTAAPPGGGLILLSGDCRRTPPNVLESSAVKPNFPPVKKDPGDSPPLPVDITGGCSGGGGGAVAMNGPLSSCTESLGFESSDQMEEMPDYAATTANSSSNSSSSGDGGGGEECSWIRQKRRRSREREVRNHREIPPPLSSLNSNGQSNFFLRPVRANGRLVLKEVKINRPDQIFRASRQDGRLRLHIAGSNGSGSDESEIFELESQKEQEIKEQDQEEEEEERETERFEVEEAKESGWKWRVPVTGGEGFRRCHEIMRSHHHHHHNHPTLWNHQCVPTR